jgi:hypothetical protein
VARVSIGLGVVLMLLGVGTYFGTGQTSITALIPAFVGIVFVVLGLVARKVALRKHAMHLSAALALIGGLGAGAMAVRTLSRGEIPRPVATASQAAMAVLCLVFVALCLRSFIAARRRRAAAGAEQPLSP